MATLQYDDTSIAGTNNAIIFIKASNIADGVLRCLEDYYDASGVEPMKEIGLKDDLISEISIILNGLK